MDAAFTNDSGTDTVARFRLGAASARPERSDLLLAGSLVIALIRRRTLAGVDVEGGAFVPYSSSYAKRKSGALGHGRVDLFSADHHTHMLNALQTVVDGNASFGVGIYTNSELETRARVHNEGLTVRTRLGKGNGKPKKGGKASFAMPRRHWLGASPSDVAMVENAIGDRISERLKRLI